MDARATDRSEWVVWTTLWLACCALVVLTLRASRTFDAGPTLALLGAVGLPIRLAMEIWRRRRERQPRIQLRRSVYR